MHAMSHLVKAIEIVGSATLLASAIGVRQSAISNWRARGTVIDPFYCVAIERATNGAVTRQDLRPDDWREIWPELANTLAAVAPAAINNEVSNG